MVESSIIESSDIGPMAHIRPKSHLQHTHIGNFVETKASVLRGVKAGHLSYLGDCEADEGSNIGAGVITCNYDGKQKHKTIIGRKISKMVIINFLINKEWICRFYSMARCMS